MLAITAQTHFQRAISRLTGLRTLHLPLPSAGIAPELGKGDPEVGPRPEAEAEVLAALDRGATHYTEIEGILPLREAVAEAIARWGLAIAAQDGIVITAGEQESRFLALMAFNKQGYRLVLPSVAHPGARKVAALALEPSFALPVDSTIMLPAMSGLSDVLRQRKSLLYIESPSRLNGKVLEEAATAEIAEAVRQTDTMVVWDASLAPWLPLGTDYPTLATMPGAAERTITIGPLWPGLGIDTWLTGYVAGCAEAIAPIRRLKQIVAICTSSPAQWGALGALRAGMEPLARMRDRLTEVRAAAIALLPKAVIPGEAVSVLAVRTPGGRKKDRERSLWSFPGEAFGAPGALHFPVTSDGAVIGACRALAPARRRPSRDPR